MQFQRRLRHDEVAEMASRRREGETVDSLSRAFDIHRTTVMSILRRADREGQLS